jgi:4-amino-4-deoxy-L-arabinose transferase-like glycosyltransferase
VDLALLIAQQAAAGLGLTLVAAAAGRLVTLRLALRDRAEALVVATASGLGALGTSLLWLGLVGGIRRWVVLAIAAAAIVSARLWPRGGVAGVPPDAEPDAGAGAAEIAPRTALLALGAALVPTFFWGLYPPTAYDATAYHLPFATAFAESHRLVEVPGLVFEIFPHLVEVLFSAMLLVTGTDIAAHLVQLLCLALIAGLLYCAGRRFYGSSRLGLWAGALWLAHPLAHYQGASGYIDVATAAFCVLALFAWEAWRDGSGRGWLVLSGAACGFAAAAKYVGLQWALLLAALTLFAAPRGRRLRGAAGLRLCAAAIAAPWYARIGMATGNPVYPMFDDPRRDPIALRRVAGPESGGIAERARTVATGVGRGIGRIPDLARFAWDASFARQRFNYQAPLAPWHLALVPLAALLAWRDPRLLRWFALTVVYFLLGAGRDPRFLLPIAAMMALAGAIGLERALASLPAVRSRLASTGVVWAVALLLAAPGPLYAAWKVGRIGEPPATDDERRRAYLARTIGGYEALLALERRVGGDYSLLAWSAPRLPHFVTGRWVFPGRALHRRALKLARLGRGEDVVRELRMHGADTLLVSEPKLRAALRADPRFAAGATLLYEDPIFDLYRLEPPPAPPG